jgi:hypothetical protein
MRIRGFSSRRLLFSLCAVLALGLVPALPAAGAAGKASCKKGAETVGCELPDGTRFHQGLGEGRSLTVGVGGKGISVTLAGVPVRCTKPASMNGGEARVGLGLSAPGHPEVGQTYKLTKTKSRSEGKGRGTTASTTEVNLRFKSGEFVLVNVHQVTTVGGKVSCDGNGSYRVERQS